MELPFLILAGLTLTYSLYLMVKAGSIRPSHLYGLITAAIFGYPGFAWKIFGSTQKAVFGICLLLLFLMVLFYGSNILLQIRRSKCRQTFDYILIPGAQVIGYEPSSSLAFRLEAAFECLERAPSAKIILSGGCKGSEMIPEAEVMERYFLKRAIAPDRIIKEEKSRSTEENIRFSLPFIDNRDIPIGIATNSFHLYRAVKTAKRFGLKNAVGIYARANPDSFIYYFSREILILAFSDIIWFLNRFLRFGFRQRKRDDSQPCRSHLQK